MASAAPLLSPEIITMRMPSARNAASASFAPGFGSSPNARTPASCNAPLVRWTTADTVAPCACRAAARSDNSPRPTPSSCIQRKLPINQSDSPIVPSVPRPGTALTFAALCASCADANERSVTALTTARANGCSLPRCTAAVLRSNSSSDIPLAATTAVNRGCPTVSVPVLSNATTSTL